ncbi:thiamine pyrophosphate-binding protein [Nocardia thailandica]
MPDRVVDHLVRTVADLGITHIFGVDGANIEDLYDAMFEAGGRPAGIVAKHEFSAATMADGYARSTGGLGVVAATSGGGAMNLVAGLAESHASRVPVLALVGQPPTALEGKGAFQDSSGRAGALDAVALFSAISVYCARVTDPDEAPAQLAAAIAAARRGGPAVLLLPKDVQQAELSPGPRAPIPGRQRAAPDLRALTEALAAARGRGKIVVLAGDQAARDSARDAFAELVACLDAAVGLAPDAKDVYDNSAPGYCGVAGSMGHPELTAALTAAETVLLVGTRFPVTARAGLDPLLAGRTVLSIGAEPPFVPAEHTPADDLATALTALTAALDDHRAAPATGPGTPALTPLAVPAASGPGLRYRELVETIDRELPTGTDVFVDAGNTGASVVHHLRVPRGGRFVVALGMGGMGYAFGAGIGSAFARHDAADGPHRTVVIAGDGAFYMHGMEIHTAVEHDLPVTFVVLNNNAHAMCVTREQVFYRDRYSFNRFRDTHIGAGVAAMFPGLPARTVTDPAGLTDALRTCLHTGGPAFLEIVCDPDEIPPFTPFLATPHPRSPS